MSRLLHGYLRLLEKYPWRTTAAGTATLMSVGDVIAQTAVEGRAVKNIELKRTGRFFLYGLCFVGPSLKGWYGILDRFVVASKTAPLKKMLLDQGLFAPCFLAVFISFMSLWKSGSVEVAKETLKRDHQAILLTNYKLWPAVQIVNFYIIPPQHRVMYVNFFALLWNIYLATKTNQGEQKDRVELAEGGERTVGGEQTDEIKRL